MDSEVVRPEFMGTTAEARYPDCPPFFRMIRFGEGSRHGRIKPHPVP